MRDPELWSKFVDVFPNVVTMFNEYSNKSQLISHTLTHGTNVLVYSAKGFPLDLFWMHVATNLFGNHTKRECLFEKYVTYYEVPHYIEIDFNHPNNKKYVDLIHDLIKMVVNSKAIASSRHLIVCKNIDCVDNMNALRVLLERFNDNAIFVCTTFNVSTIDAPIKSRFFNVRIPLFSVEQVTTIMQMIGGRFHVRLQQMNCRNIIKCIAIADMEKQGFDVELAATYNYPPIRDFMSTKRNHNILQIREFSNKLCSLCITFRQVVDDLLFHVDDKVSFIREASQLEHCLTQTNGGRKPLYYELLFNIAIYGKPDNTSNQ